MIQIQMDQTLRVPPLMFAWQTTRVSVAPIEFADLDLATARPWVTIVWNDPINLMTYVTFVFQDYFGYDKSKAERLMMDVHHKGKAVVSAGTREEMERDVAAMHSYGLWATTQRDDS